MSLRRRAPNVRKDDGSAIVIALAFVMIGAMFVTPMLRYAIAVTHTGRSQQQKLERAEAVKGAFRAVMADPAGLYESCSNSGLHNEVTLASAQMDVPVTTTCTTVKNATELTASELRIAMTTTVVGTSAPAGTVGSSSPPVVAGSENAWVANSSTTSQGGKILLPNLPAHALTHPSSAGYMMPSWVGSCRVFFPGTYNDPITITNNVPVYFTSGIYYFDNTVTISGSANVVVGGGTVEGCTNDQEAAFEALGAPGNHNISGYGATWIFGGAGRLVFNDQTAGTGPSLQFNSRLVADTDIGTLSSRSVSILSVNGVDGGGNVAVDFNLPGSMFVPKSMNSATPPAQAMVDGYVPSTLRPDGLGTPYPAIVDVSFTGTNPAKLWIPGYIGVPQGYINLSVATPAAAAGKDVQFLGGVLTGYFTQSPDLPATLQLGIVNRVVQKTFKVVAISNTDSPRVVSTALVQINDYGEFVVNAWEISVCQPSAGNPNVCIELPL
ncbi:MAG: hypothetical protein ABMA25_00500 [Ilumatobacteraceae bacterium]